MRHGSLGPLYGKVTRHKLREAWPHEAMSFTAWLNDNIDVVGEAIGIELVRSERERSAGDFRLDLLAEDANGSLVAIENQFGRSDHDHLGKLITYLTAFEAQTAVWIVEEPRPEHVRAITWLNEASSGSFYMLKLEAISIAGSPPAPLFTVIVGPSEESREVGTVKRERAERHVLRREFWTELLDYARTRTQLHAGRSPGESTILSTSAGIAGFSYTYFAREHDTLVELSINTKSGETNLRAFQDLLAQRSAIEREFGGRLDWDTFEGKRICAVRHGLTRGGYRDRDSWPDIIEGTVDAMIRLERAVGPYVSALRL